MRTKMQKYTSAMMAAVMALSMGSMQASAADDVQNIVVIGDSVAAGNALTDAEQSYVELVGEYTGAKVQNFAAAGNFSSYNSHSVIFSGMGMDNLNFILFNKFC